MIFMFRAIPQQASQAISANAKRPQHVQLLVVRDSAATDVSRLMQW